MKNVKRVFNATRGRWVKVICKDEPAPKTRAELEKMFSAMMRGPAPAPAPPSRDNGRSR